MFLKQENARIENILIKTEITYNVDYENIHRICESQIRVHLFWL